MNNYEVLLNLKQIRDAGNGSIVNNFESVICGYWPFNDGYAHSEIEDLSPNLNHGLSSGLNVQDDWDPGVSGTCVNFNGSNEYITIPHDTSLQTIRSFACWVTPRIQQSLSTVYNIIFSKSASDYCGLFFNRNTSPDKICFRMRDSISNQSTLSYSITGEPDEWYFVVGNYYSNGVTELYVDGVLAASASNLNGSFKSDMTNSPIYIGGGVTNKYSFCLVDEAMVWSRCMALAEIQRFYNYPGSYLGQLIEFNRSFIDIQSITVTPKATKQLTAIYDFLDIPNPENFMVYLYDNQGRRVVGDFSWSATGH